MEADLPVKKSRQTRNSRSRGREYALHGIQPNKKDIGLISKAESAARRGQLEQAHEISRSVTRRAPEFTRAWMVRAKTAPSLEEKIRCLNTLYELQPGHQGGQRTFFRVLNELIQQDPFLGYLDETKHIYRVRSGRRSLNVPKYRAEMEPFTKKRRGPYVKAQQYLRFALFGLLLAGTGALVFAPLAARSAARSKRNRTTPPEKTVFLVIMIQAVGLTVLGLILSFLFALHWIG